MWSWPPMVTVICCSGRSARTIFLMLMPVRSWSRRETASAVNTMVRWASIASRVRWNIGRARRSVLDIRNDCSTCHRSW